MKRIAALLLLLLLLCGCGTETPNTEPTQPPAGQWLRETATPWDTDGILLEVPLTISGGLHYSSGMEFDGDLLLWSVDNHLAETMFMELCLVDLDSGAVQAQQEIPVQEYTYPQALEGSLYLCDSTGGTVYQLDKSLRETARWSTEPGFETWHMGANETLYRVTEDSRLLAENLADGTAVPVLEGDPYTNVMTVSGEAAVVEYYRNDTGAVSYALLDLKTGTVTECDFGYNIQNVSCVDGTWMYHKFRDGFTYYLKVKDGTSYYMDTGYDTLALLDEGYILRQDDENMFLQLYDFDGNPVSRCQISETGIYYPGNEMIWNEALGGYFFQIYGDDSTGRLLFWDISKGSGGEKLALLEQTENSDVLAAVRQRAEQLQQEYGLTILIGEDCETEFDDFSASIMLDEQQISAALDTLETALEAYPDGFVEQLRYDSIHGVQIQLVTDLIATGNGRSGDGYVAFTQPLWDRYLMVVDIEDSCVETYYHEFSHIIDSYLEWDSWQRVGALYAEDRWASYNPDWFSGYTYDYSTMVYVEDYAYFVDEYSTISPTEDRARIMEYAMADYGGGMFMGADGLLDKLDYYSRCIRDAFDTSGWPETVLWEQYLP